MLPLHIVAFPVVKANCVYKSFLIDLWFICNENKDSWKAPLALYLVSLKKPDKKTQKKCLVLAVGGKLYTQCEITVLCRKEILLQIYAPFQYKFFRPQNVLVRVKDDKHVVQLVLSVLLEI